MKRVILAVGLCLLGSALVLPAQQSAIPAQQNPAAPAPPSAGGTIRDGRTSPSRTANAACRV